MLVVLDVGSSPLLRRTRGKSSQQEGTTTNSSSGGVITAVKYETSVQTSTQQHPQASNIFVADRAQQQRNNFEEPKN